MIETILFFTFASMVLAGSLLTITRRNPLVSSVWLVFTLAASAGIFALLAAPFIAVLQILIYAGAIMVLFIFVIMLIDLGAGGMKPRMIRFGKVLGASAAVYLAVIVGIVMWRYPTLDAPALPASFTDPALLGELLMTKYVVPFEFVSVALLAAIVGSLVLAKKKL